MTFSREGSCLPCSVPISNRACCQNGNHNMEPHLADGRILFETKCAKYEQKSTWYRCLWAGSGLLGSMASTRWNSCLKRAPIFNQMPSFLNSNRCCPFSSRSTLSVVSLLLKPPPWADHGTNHSSLGQKAIVSRLVSLVAHTHTTKRASKPTWMKPIEPNEPYYLTTGCTQYHLKRICRRRLLALCEFCACFCARLTAY